MSAVYVNVLSGALGLPAWKVENTLALLNEGATIPFIARYRKEATGSLDEVQVAEIQKEFKRLEELDKRREAILHSIEEQGKLTDELRQKIEAAHTLTELEDLYLPYKPKRKTRASVARERGLEPLARRLWLQVDTDNPEKLAQGYLTDDVPTVADALQGARDILAEEVSENPDARNLMRFVFSKTALIKSKIVKGKDEAGAKYRDYFDYSEPLKDCPSHRLLAIRRGEEEDILRVLILPADEEAAVRQLQDRFVKGYGPSSQQVELAVQDCYERLLSPSIETEFRNSSKEKAGKEAIDVFVKNLRQLLLAPPLGQKRVLGIDPGFRTGCKVIVLDASGNFLENTTIYPHPPQNDDAGARKTLDFLVQKHGIEAIAVGNGTAGRETMDLCRSIRFPHPVEIFMANEAGASIYSASDVAREEFPDHDVTVRGAISIGRRLMDPLAELVKIDPKSIGVGQYQHDVNQAQLKESLDQVVESCVNSVGVNLNTASKHLLTYVSGLGPALAKNIVEYRAANGPFESRSQLKKVPRLGDKAFEQCAGFLRIRQAKNPLDNTGVHPESYGVVLQMAKDQNSSLQDLIADAALRKGIDLKKYVTDTVGLPTLNDILKELAKPGLDPRGEAKSFSFADNVKTIDDLYPGMVLPGIINNITNFGVFVDIGVKESGLVHVSQIANKFVKNPADVVSLHQEVLVKVLEIDHARGRVQLTMKNV
ncbi:MAG: RNA-binding transcriptional accessory protein [Haliscomenobacter sp.]|nr:RNA-binding transcriptional accessory protein [Haliscomenobacter sp.]